MDAAGLVALEFWDDMGIVVNILLFFLLYSYLSASLVKNSILALIVTAVITWLVIIPYPSFAWILFIILFLGSAFGQIKFSEW